MRHKTLEAKTAVVTGGGRRGVFQELASTSTQFGGTLPRRPTRTTSPPRAAHKTRFRALSEQSSRGVGRPSLRNGAKFMLDSHPRIGSGSTTS